MSQEIDIIGTYPEKLVFQSNYVPLISFKNEEQKKAAEDYIIQEADIFFRKILPRQTVTQLAYPKLITENDFTKEPITYFYENLFYDLKRNLNGKLEAKIKWGITFDEKCAPLNLAWAPETYARPEPPNIYFHDQPGRPHRKFGTIDINGKPVFYYVYFTLQEILDVIKQLPNS
jgi:hypothetical protein